MSAPEAAGAPQPAAARPPMLPRDWVATWLTVLMAAAMGFLAALGLAALLAADKLADSWTSALEGRVTVSLIAEPGLSAEARAGLGARGLAAIAATPGVLAAAIVSDADMSETLAPWLGEAFSTAELGLPILIDVEIDPAAARAGGPETVLAAVAARLADQGMPAEMDAHDAWVDRLRPAAAAVTRLAQGALAAIALAATLAVALACAAGLAAQAHVVDVLLLVGAEDRYIARLLVRRAQALSFVGAALGVALAAAAIALAAADAPSEPLQGAASGGLGAAELAPLAPDLAPGVLGWALIACLPLAFVLIATVAARAAVEAALARRDR